MWAGRLTVGAFSVVEYALDIDHEAKQWKEIRRATRITRRKSERVF